MNNTETLISEIHLKKHHKVIDLYMQLYDERENYQDLTYKERKQIHVINEFNKIINDVEDTKI
jgi:hypothetical protein